MNSGWRYRIAAMGGPLVLTAVVVALVNNEVVLSVAAALPVLGRLANTPPQGAEVAFEILTATAVFAAAMVPPYKPRPRRILDTTTIAQRGGLGDDRTGRHWLLRLPSSARESRRSGRA